MDLDDNMVCPAPVCIYEQLHIGVVKLRVIPLADLFFGVDITFITSKTERIFLTVRKFVLFFDSTNWYKMKLTRSRLQLCQAPD